MCCVSNKVSVFVLGHTIPVLVVWATQLSSDYSDLSHLATIGIVSPDSAGFAYLNPQGHETYG